MPRSHEAGAAAQQLDVASGERRGRLDAELIGEQPAEVVVHPQRLDVTAGGRQRRHQQLARALAQRVLVGEGGQLGEHVVTRAGAQLGVGTHLDRPDAQLVETAGLGPARIGVGELGVGGPAPGRQVAVEQPRRQQPGRRRAAPRRR